MLSIESLFPLIVGAEAPTFFLLLVDGFSEWVSHAARGIFDTQDLADGGGNVGDADSSGVPALGDTGAAEDDGDVAIVLPRGAVAGAGTAAVVQIGRAHV